MRIIKEGINDKYLFKSVFMAGGGGSGKGWVVKNLFGLNKDGGVSPYGVKVVNSDAAFEYFLKKNSLPMEINAEDRYTYDKQMIQRELAKALTAKRLDNFIQGMLPIIMDGTGKDLKKIEAQANDFLNIGYDVSMVFVNTTLEVAQKRNAMRARKLDPDLIEKSWYEVQNNLGKFQKYFGNNNFVIVDNSQEHSEEDVKKVINELFREGRKLLERPLENKKGQFILDYLRKSGGKYLSDFDL